MEMIRKAFSPLRRVYDWMVNKADHPHAERYLAGLAFAESSFFPIPPDVLLIAMGFCRREKALRYALICSVGSIAGGIVGYGIGYGLYEAIGAPIVAFYQLQELMISIGTKYEANAFLTVFTAAFTPIPFKLITIAAGLFKISFGPFIIASAIGRSARFFMVALVIRELGPRARPFIEKYFELFTVAFTVLLVGGFLALKYLR